MNSKTNFICLALLAFSGNVLADSYQCQMPDGGIIKYLPKATCKLTISKSASPYYTEHCDTKIQLTDLGIMVSSDNMHITKKTLHFIVPELSSETPHLNATQFTGILIETENAPSDFPYMKARNRVIKVKDCVALKN